MAGSMFRSSQQTQTWLHCFIVLLFFFKRTNTKLGKQGGWRDSEELEEGKEYAQVILYEILKKEKILF